MHNGDWTTIIKVPSGNSVFFDRWTPVASGFMIFIFFGFGRDATRMYRIIFWYLGFGHCFPGIEPPTTQDGLPSPRAESETTLVGTIGSRAKSFFSRTGGTLVANSTWNDIEKGRSGSISGLGSGSDSSRWRTWLSGLFGRRKTLSDNGTLLQDLEGRTVHTNAWSSQRGSGDYSIGPRSPVRNKDFIHVRQVISQQSEVQIEI
jgi:pheromone a factor receptor